MFKIKVNNTHTFDLSKETLKTTDIIVTSQNHYHILDKNKALKAKILDANFNTKNYSVQVNNNTYDVKINDELDQQIEALGFEIGSSIQVNDIKAPMPGLILEINVKKGQEIKENDAVLILEAMKMENVINSPRDGVIKSITVKQGQTVDKNSLLIEFE